MSDMSWNSQRQAPRFWHHVTCRLRNVVLTLYPLMAGITHLQQQVLNRIQWQAQALLTSSRHSVAARLETLGFQNGLAMVQTIEQHLQQRSRLNIHFSASSVVTMTESGRSSEILNAWLHDTQYIVMAFRLVNVVGTRMYSGVPCGRISCGSLHMH